MGWSAPPVVDIGPNASVDITGPVTVENVAGGALDISSSAVVLYNGGASELPATVPATPLSSGYHAILVKASAMPAGGYLYVVGKTSGIQYGTVPVNLQDVWQYVPFESDLDEQVTISVNSVGAGESVTAIAVRDVAAVTDSVLSQALVTDTNGGSGPYGLLVAGWESGVGPQMLAVDSDGRLDLPAATYASTLQVGINSSGSLAIPVGTVVRGLSYAYSGTPTTAGNAVVTDGAANSLLNLRVVQQATALSGVVPIPAGGYVMQSAELSVAFGGAGTGSLTLTALY